MRNRTTLRLICAIFTLFFAQSLIADERVTQQSADVFVIPESFDPAVGEIILDEREAGSLDLSPIAIKYGINFISSAEEPADNERYNNGLSTGAKWNRWPLYWHTIEKNADQFDFSAHDPIVIADTERGLIVNAVMMGIPGFYFSGNDAVPNTLYEPIFSDGSDIPAPGKTININNKWARWIYATVERYKPYGILSQQQGWTTSRGIQHWELWNEPDLPEFFDGNKTDYARLLKVGYMAVKQADPQAMVLFGSMANNFNDLHYYESVLGLLSSDPLAQQHGYFHDAMATHSYYYPWQSWYHVYRARVAMDNFNIDKEIWLNEMGVPVWDDYPGPVWDAYSPYRATMAESADYTIMSSFYAVYAGATALFHFQLYDGCGNQPQGTNFPPHDGQLCRSDGMLVSDPSKPCSGDAFGMFRNSPESICFNQHPQVETARDSFAAYKLLTQYLQDVTPLARFKVCTHGSPDNDQEWIAFYRPNTNQRIMALWSCTGQPKSAVIPAIETGALLITPDGTERFISPAANGNYYLTLPAATNRNYPNPNDGFWPLGGHPYILIERDLQAPSVGIDGTEQGNGIAVNWWGNDGMGSGVQDFTIRVAVDGGTPRDWLVNTTTTSALFTDPYQHGVEFTVSGRDYGGNIRTATKLVGTLPPLEAPTLSLSADKQLVTIDDRINFTIQFSNPSGSPNNNVNFVNTLPAPFIFLDNSQYASKGEATYSSGAVRWSGSLAPYETVTLGFGVRVNWVNSASEVVQNSITLNDGHNNTVTQSVSVTVLNRFMMSEKVYLPGVRHRD